MDETSDPRVRLVTELVELRSVANAADARCAEITAELVALDDGHPLECRSPEQFLSWQAGLPHGPAKALVEVGERFAELPSLRDASKSGRLSLWQARAIASVARDDEDAAKFVELAAHTTTGQLQAACSHAKRARRTDEDADAVARRGRRLRTWWSTAGTLRLDGELDAETGAVVTTALEEAAKLIPTGTTSRADDPVGARGADALGVLARAFLEPSPDHEPAARVSVHVGLAELTGTGESDPSSEVCRLGWNGVGVSDGLARRLGCDAAIQAVIRDADGNPLALGRSRRVVNRALRRALVERDGHCQAPRCDATRFLHAHHVVHWADGGATDLDNLVLVCHWHHTAIHDGHLTAAVIDGQPTVVGQQRAPRPPPTVRGDPVAAAHQAGITPEPDAAKPGYAGGSIDYACFDAAFNQPPP